MICRTQYNKTIIKGSSKHFKLFRQMLVTGNSLRAWLRINKYFHTITIGRINAAFQIHQHPSALEQEENKQQ